ncbi:dynein regulatory complex subunit 2 isoform X1 [Strigops habroptila]|uniref:dynein regulatory complex subunit 2 isoform X1 n=1 Tax=Strigops habroptila TaxID=2489341 RepID=UPI0011D011A0|nr:dynein regulatory complex subunit 2 isoform X1 [Strigops habroptila]
MAAKRRSGAGAPMAAEDELLLLQSQALAEEEAAKRKREILTRFLKDKVAKEGQSSALSLHKLHAQWRVVLREAKAEELRRDVHVLSRTFARVMDCKDSAIESLAADLEEAEEQHARALRSHLFNVDRLLQLQRCRLACLQDGYSAQLQALQAAFEEERRTIVEQHERESCYLQDMALATEQNQAKNDMEITLKFQSSRDDIKNESLQEKQYTRLQLGGKLEELWKQVRRAVQGYAEATERQRVAFEALKQKDEKSSREVEAQTKKLQKLQDSIAAIKSRLVALLRESEEQNRRMREEKEKVLGELRELKAEMSQMGAEAHDSLLRLTLQSGAALKALARVVEKAQRILRLAEMCRRMETEEEKVLPFYPSSLEEEEQEDAQRVLQETPVEPLAWVRSRSGRGAGSGLGNGTWPGWGPPTRPLAQAVRDSVGLERFWQRFNKAKLEEQALERQRAALSRRNRRLRDLLRQYLAGISITQEVLSEPNPLLAVRHKSCVPRAVPRTGGDCAAHPKTLPHPIHGSSSTA